MGKLLLTYVECGQWLQKILTIVVIAFEIITYIFTFCLSLTTCLLQYINSQ